MISKILAAHAFVTRNAQVSFGSLPANTNFDFVDMYADLSNFLTETQTQVTFYLKGTAGGIETLLKTYGPFGSKLGGFRIGQLEAQPGVTYTLYAAVTAGPVPSGVTVTAGLVGFNATVNEPFEVDSGSTALPFNVETTMADVSETHSQWNFRVKLNSAPYPASTFRFYNIISYGALTISALIKEQAYTQPPTAEGFQPFVVDRLGADRVKITGQAKDIRASGTNQITAGWALIGTDPILDGASGVTATSLAQTAWYINPLIGDDSWDGTAAAHVAGTSVGPIATAAEYLRRTGLNRPIANPVDIYIEADLPDTDPLVVTGTVIAQDAYIYVHGSNLTPIITGTIDAYVTPNAATNRLPKLTDAAVANWNLYSGKLLRVTSGAHAGDAGGNGSMWIEYDLGAGDARVSQPLYRVDASNVAPFAPGAQNYEIVSPRLLAGGLVLNVLSAISPVIEPVRVDYVEVPTSFVAGVNSNGPLGGTFFECLFDLYQSQAAFSTYLNCQWNGFALFQGTNAALQGGYWNAATLLIESCTITVTGCALAIRGGSMSFADSAGGAINIKTGGVQMEATTNYWNLQNGAQLIVRSDIYGVAATGTMYIVGAGCQLLCSNMALLRIGGATNDITVANKTQIFPYDAATGVLQATIRTCSLANLVNAGLFNNNIHDPFTGTQVLTIV